MTPLKPFFMWAGGKTKLLKHYNPILPDITKYDVYVEPFLGGAAMFGSVTRRFKGQSVLGDFNSELIEVYEALKLDPAEFMEEATKTGEKVLAGTNKEERKALYYENLQNYWASPTAGKLYALMRLGFNGIWQTNKKSEGKFATPAGLLNQKDISRVVDEDHLKEWSAQLQNVRLHSGSYKNMVIPENKKALIYLDPPYRDSFTTYGTGFDDSDQLELIDWCLEQSKKGHTVLLANRCVEGDEFFEEKLPEACFHYFDVTYTAGRRKRTDDGFEAKPAKEFLAVL